MARVGSFNPGIDVALGGTLFKGRPWLVVLAALSGLATCGGIVSHPKSISFDSSDGCNGE